MKSLLKSFAACAAVCGLVGSAAADETRWTINDAHSSMSDGVFTMTISGYPNIDISKCTAGGTAKLSLVDNFYDTAGNKLEGVHIVSISGTQLAYLGSATEIYIDLPELTSFGDTSTYKDTFRNFTGTKMTIRTPKAVSTSGRMLYQTNLSDSRLDDWDLTGVETFGNMSPWSSDVGTSSGPTGTLRLPKLKTIVTANNDSAVGGLNRVGASTIIMGDPDSDEGIGYLNKSFFRSSGVTNVVIYSRQFKNICCWAFANCPIKSLTLGGEQFETISSNNPFTNVSLDELIVLGKVPSTQNAIDLLAGATGSYKVWRVSRLQEGWSTLSGLVTDKATIEADGNYANLSDADKTALIGRYYNSAKKKYIWLVDRRSEYDPKDTEVAVEVRGLNAADGRALSIGTVTPSYGLRKVTKGVGHEFSSFDYWNDGDLLYRPIGYVREDYDGDEIVSTVTNLMTSPTLVFTCKSRISWLYEKCGGKVAIESNQRAIRPMIVEAADFGSNYYCDGRELHAYTFENEAFPHNGFTGWRADGVADGTNLAFTVQAPMVVMAMYDAKWMYANNSLDNGDYAFSASGYPELNLTKCTTTGGRVLNFSGSIYDSAGQVLEGAYMREFSFSFNSDGHGGNLRELTIDLPELLYISPTTGGKDTFRNCPISKCTIRAPKLKTTSSRMLYDRDMPESSFDEWDLSGLETLGESSPWSSDVGSANGPTGTLRLPKLTTLETSIGNVGGFNRVGASTIIIGDPRSKTGITYLNKSFFRSSGVTNVVLYSRRLTSLGPWVFGNASNLKSLTLGGENFSAIDASGVFSAVSLNDLTILGHIPPDAAMNLLASGTKSYGVWRVSHRQGWKKLTGLVTDMDQIQASHGAAYAELSACDKENLLGIFTRSNKNLWLVDAPSPYDDVGMKLVFR